MFKSSTTAAVLHRDVDRRSYIYITADANGKAGVELSIGTGFRIGLRYAKLKSIENQVRPPVSKNTNGFFTNLVNERRAGRYMSQLNSERYWPRHDEHMQSAKG